MGPLIEAVERHAPEHLRFGPVPREEITAFEADLGRLLPPALTAVLESVGNGIFFGKEELLGPRRLSPDAFGQVHAWPGGAPRGEIADFLADRLTPR